MFLKKLISQSGISLIEVVVAMVVGILVVFGSAQLIVYGNQSSAYYKKSRGLVETLSFVLAEIEYMPVSQLPPENTCRLRRYNTQGSIVDELDHTGVDCLEIPPEAGIYSVGWQTKPQSTLDVSFEHDTYMKLPSSLDEIRPIEVYGQFMDPRTRTPVVKKITTLRSAIADPSQI